MTATDRAMSSSGASIGSNTGVGWRPIVSRHGVNYVGVLLIATTMHFVNPLLENTTWKLTGALSCGQSSVRGSSGVKPVKTTLTQRFARLLCRFVVGGAHSAI